MQRTVSIALLAAAFVALPAAAQSGAKKDPGLESVAFEIRSWGRPIDSWEVHDDGTARHVKRVSSEGPASIPTVSSTARSRSIQPSGRSW